MHRVLIAAGLALPLLATAADAPPDPDDSLGSTRWVLGASLNEGPIYFGQRQRAAGLKGLFALRWRGLRISNSGAGSLLGDGVAGGASTELYSDARWRVRLGLRIDRGRFIEDDDEQRLKDLPRVRSTLRARLQASHSLGEQGSLSLSVMPDVLDRGGGLLVQAGYFRLLPQLDLALPRWRGHWSFSGSLVGGDRRYMDSYFGIPPGGQRLPAYRAGSGLRSLALGLGWQRNFGERDGFVLFGGATREHLLGPAARSPFVQTRGAWRFQLGLAYRG